MYLEHFNFAEFPFGLTPNTQYFCNLPSYQEALNVLLLSLRSGEGFIKIVGEVGTGKTLLCHELLNNLGSEYVTAYVSNPAINSGSLRKIVAQELGIEFHGAANQLDVLNAINQRLLDINREGKKVVLLIDEAQVLSDQSFESLRLLSNLETESSKLLQIVLLGQTELDDRLNQQNLRQLKQRIAFSYYLRPISRSELQIYVDHRLHIAGNRLGSLFSKRAYDVLYRASKGIPRLVNILSHKALLAAYGKDIKRISHKEMRSAVFDTDSVRPQKRSWQRFLVNCVIIALLSVVLVELLYILGPYL
ncbi:MAG: AAA family ATPase [Gammaproteobacteria bacterium]|nr:AAA family ATPase [Gammaproteobacteria bacterium]